MDDQVKMEQLLVSKQRDHERLVETVVSVLREDINIPDMIAYKVMLRQPPVDDDHDNWAESGPRDNWFYVAHSIISIIDRYHNEQQQEKK